MITEAREKRKTRIFDIGGNVDAFDSTTIDLYLSVFWWAKFRKRKGGIKIHTLYDMETQIPTFFHITAASVNDVKAMDAILNEQGPYYVFEREYNDFKRLYRIDTIEACRGKGKKFSTGPLNGNADCLRMCCQAALSN